MKVVLTTLNAKYIHKNLALRWLYVTSPIRESVVLEEFTIKDSHDKVLNKLVDEQADVYCFSCYIWNIKQTLALIKDLKLRLNGCKVLVGGPEVTFESEYLLHEGVDAISIGEGELTVWEYIQSLMDHDPHKIAGINTLDYLDHTYAYSDLSVNEAADSPYFLPFDEADMDKRYLYFETSRGCPYGCEYCLSSTDKKVRQFSEAYIFRELEKISQSNVRQVKFLDRTFNTDPKRALRIARYINEHCPNQIFQFEVVAETLSEELLSFFIDEADKNRFRFEVGVQSFNTNTLKAVGRIQNNARLKEVITRMREAGLILHVDLIAGLPYEGMSSFDASFNELFSLKASELQLGILKLLKGTGLKRKSELYDFVYDSDPPYEILSTAWLNRCELMDINHTALAVEKFWNSGKCRKAIDTILKLKLRENAFSLFMELGKKLALYERRYHDHDLFLILKETLADCDEKLIESILMSDYMGLFKQKPKRWNKLRVDHETAKHCFQLLIDAHESTQNELYHYGCVDLAYSEGLCLQVIVYNAQQTYPKRWLIKENERIEKI